MFISLIHLRPIYYTSDPTNYTSFQFITPPTEFNTYIMWGTEQVCHCYWERAGSQSGTMSALIHTWNNFYKAIHYNNRRGYSNPAGDHVTFISQRNLTNCRYNYKILYAYWGMHMYKINYATGFHDADMIGVGSLCRSGLCATCAQTFLSCNYITLETVWDYNDMVCYF